MTPRNSLWRAHVATRPARRSAADDAIAWHAAPTTTGGAAVLAGAGLLADSHPGRTTRGRR